MVISILTLCAKVSHFIMSAWLLFTHKLHFWQVTQRQITSDHTCVQIIRFSFEILDFRMRTSTKWSLICLAYTYKALVAI